MLSSIKKLCLFNEEVFHTIEKKCRKETKYGRVLNLLFWIGVSLFRKIKLLKGASLRDYFKVLDLKPVQQLNTNHRWENRISLAAERKLILLIVEDSLPQCKLYRVDARKNELDLLGVEYLCFSAWDESEEVLNVLPFASLVWFYRVPCLERWQRVVNLCKRFQIKTLWEVDDLVFDVEEYSKHPFLKTCDPKLKKELLTGAELFCRLLKQCDFTIASTEPLRKFLLQLNSNPCFLLENRLPNSILNTFVGPTTNISDSDQIVICYGSGTITHDDDLSWVAPMLAGVLSKYHHLRLLLIGHLTVPPALQTMKKQLIILPFLSSSEYYKILSQTHIFIAPLMLNHFNDCKSNLKYIEAGFFEIPCVASPTQPFFSAISDGKNGFLAKDPLEWTEKLKKLIESKELRSKMGKNAKLEIVKNYSLEKIATAQTAFILDSVLPKTVVTLQNKKPTILFVNVFFFPSSYGGATVVTEELAYEFMKLGYNVAVFAGNITNQDTHEKLSVFKFHNIPVFSVNLSKFSHQAYDFNTDQYLSLFEQTLRTVKPDLVYFHCIQKLGAGMFEVAEQLNVPYYLNLHDYWWICSRQFRFIEEKSESCTFENPRLFDCINCTKDVKAESIRKEYLTKALDKPKQLICPSQSIKLRYKKSGVEDSRLFVVENGIKPPGSAWKKPKSGGKLTFAYLGGPSKLKGYHLIKEAFEQVQSANFKLVLTDSEKKLGINTGIGAHFKIKGELEVVAPFTRETIDAFFSEVDVLIAFSLWEEVFGLVVREALIRDVWVIGSDAGAIPEAIVPGKNGTIVERGNVGKLKEAIETCIEKYDEIKGFCNPFKDQITTFETQAKTLEKLFFF